MLENKPTHIFTGDLMKTINETKTFLVLISALFLVSCSHFNNQINTLEEELAVEEEVQETSSEKSADQIWEELAEKDSKK